MKAQFVSRLEALVKTIPDFHNLARMDYDKKEGDGTEFLYLTFTNKSQMRINITGDSEIAIMKDFLMLNEKGRYISPDSPDYRPEYLTPDFNLQAILNYFNGCSVQKDVPFDDTMILRVAAQHEMSPIDLKEQIYQHYSDPCIPEWAKPQQRHLSEYYMTHTYCEVGFDTDDFICIICDHAPTKEELLWFCQKDMELYGASDITSFAPISFKEAHDLYDMEMEGSFPVCSSEKPDKSKEELER